MPHIVVEYSANLEEHVEVRGLVDAIHAAALETGVLPIGGLRTRAERREIYAIADGDPEHVFVAVAVRMGHGRDEDTRGAVAARLMAALEEQTAELFRSRGVALSVEIQEIDPVASLKTNNLHQRLKKEQAA